LFVDDRSGEHDVVFLNFYPGFPATLLYQKADFQMARALEVHHLKTIDFTCSREREFGGSFAMV
jgi:hypothetical protein